MRSTWKITAAGLITGLFLPAFAFAQETATTQTVLGEVSNFAELISLIWSYGSQVIIALAVFFIVLGAFFYVSSGGNEDRVDQGKQMVFGSFIAILIVIFSGVLIRTLHKPAEGTTGYLTDVPTVINYATTILVGIIGVFSVFMLVYAGFLYVTAQGDEEKVNKAHSAIKYAVIGLVLGVTAFSGVRLLIQYFV
jgi:hypothetical protein